MSRRLERLTQTGGAAVLAASIALSGCGRADLKRSATAPARSARAARGERGTAGPDAGPGAKQLAPRVAVPLPLTAARAASFASAVTLSRADLPGSAPSPRSKRNPSEEREAAKCGARETKAIGGGRSPDFQRGKGLDRESISSGVDVLSDASAVKGDLAYTASRAGLTCYAKVLTKSLRGEADTSVRILGLHVSTLGLGIGPGQQARGIRITARVGIAGSGITVRLFVDALSLPYGPAELDLYTTSFVQPVAERTASELLTLLSERARLHPL
ncbi:MAG TPA: hypothetical protein VF927_12130 [Solirubrobacteraceae bacterium]